MDKQTHNQRVAKMAKKLRDEKFETAIAKKLKEKYPDIKKIKFDTTGKNDKTGFYWTTFHITAGWTKNQPEDGYSQINYVSIQVIQNNRYSMQLSDAMYKYEDTGKTDIPVLVVYSSGKDKEI